MRNVEEGEQMEGEMTKWRESVGTLNGGFDRVGEGRGTTEPGKQFADGRRERLKVKILVYRCREAKEGEPPWTWSGMIVRNVTKSLVVTRIKRFLTWETAECSGS